MQLALIRFTPAERLAVRTAVAAKIAAETALEPTQMGGRYMRHRAIKSIFGSLRGRIINSRNVATACRTITVEAAALQEVADAYALISLDGPVSITDDRGDREIARFATITDAEQYLNIGPEIVEERLRDGHYSINAPHGLGSDLEAVRAAESCGFQIFASMGDYYYAPKGTPVSGNVSGKGWKGSFDTAVKAALAALETVDP